MLAASGGKLELEKCFYYLLTWKFDGDGNAYFPESIHEQQSLHKQIAITDEASNKTITITHKDISTPHKTLGAMKTLSGCKKAQIHFLQAKSNAFANKMCGARLNRIQAMLAY